VRKIYGKVLSKQKTTTHGILVTLYILIKQLILKFGALPTTASVNFVGLLLLLPSNANIGLDLLFDHVQIIE
jgi:hypothetical protein